MIRILGTLLLLIAVSLPTLSQVQQMTTDDQQQFNSYYSRWLADRQRGDRDDMISMEHHMQDLMSRYDIAPSTPYDEVASQTSQPPVPAYDNRTTASQWQSVLSSDDQDKFNKEYTKWQEANAKNDRDDIDKHARNMEQIMSRYNIPPNTRFADIATVSGYSQRIDVREYQGRFSPDDQKDYDKAYENWQKDRAKGDRDDVYKDEGKMQQIMAKYNIPRGVPYDALASGNRGY